ncbi:hypothetical protein BCR33DRAFT_764709 [Rhizoclosmatium globosum]|uniref:Uncharacterized protein n=1 Tax=Rhizoclosmatium globosum TaxID=329046 RepID=A0A1Y2CHD0_9FUNG|nr:hypothetical protein BCR33DRAFT_764709 [Rhizoclosmatium globosum]|eukprot:ORY46317.1 hypothetical protein BCR33DRAFT_764709 [Rhizoclosmatium globosum]
MTWCANLWHHKQSVTQRASSAASTTTECPGNKNHSAKHRKILRQQEATAVAISAAPAAESEGLQSAIEHTVRESAASIVRMRQDLKKTSTTNAWLEYKKDTLKARHPNVPEEDRMPLASTILSTSWNSLKDTNKEALLTHMKAQGVKFQPYLALVPMLHVLVHGSGCQVALGPKVSLGSGTFDGEVIERLWAEIESHAGPLQIMTFENRLDSIFLMVEFNTVAKNKAFLSVIEKSIETALLRIASVKSTLESFESVEIKSYSITVQENIQTRTTVFRRSPRDSFGEAEVSGFNYLKAKAPHVQDEALKIWSKLCTLAVEFNGIKRGSKLIHGTKAAGNLAMRLKTILKDIRELMTAFNALPDYCDDNIQATGNIDSQAGFEGIRTECFKRWDDSGWVFRKRATCFLESTSSVGG